MATLSEKMNALTRRWEKAERRFEDHLLVALEQALGQCCNFDQPLHVVVLGYVPQQAELWRFVAEFAYCVVNYELLRTGQAGGKTAG
jgi:hypothetical protein